MYRNRKFGLKTVSNLAAQKSIENSQQLNVSKILSEINGPSNAKIQRLEVSFLFLLNYSIYEQGNNSCQSPRFYQSFLIFFQFPDDRMLNYMSLLII